MGDPKSRYEMSRALMNTLPPIKEESFLSTSSGGTPRNVRQVVVNNRPVLVQTLPQDPRLAPPTPRPDVPERSEEQDSIDQVVSDYLHYARYSASLPVQTELGNTDRHLYCSCCTERNRENIRRQRGFPPEKPDYPTSKKADDSVEEVTPRSSEPLYSPMQSWMSYQPLPYAQTYLSPEFSRPSVVDQYHKEMKGDDESLLTKAKILDSSTKYDQAMKKLKFTTQKLDPKFDDSQMSFS